MSDDIQTSQQQAATEEAPARLPAVDIHEDESGITVHADLPGVSREGIGVRVDGDNLVIEGAASVPAPSGMELQHLEIRNPRYRRSFTLSRELDPSRIEATMKDGVLSLHIPKAESAKPRRIAVNVG